MRGFSILALATLSATTASAADRRIQTLVYDPEQIVQIIGHEGIQSTVEFGPDERIENIAVGDSSAWQITPNRRASLLFLKPLVRATRTNMTVVTDRHLYMFDLVAALKGGSPVYALKFTYPNEKPPVAQATVQMAEPTPTAPTFSPDQLNFGWQTKGFDQLLPSRIFDDGRTLYLAWDREVALPAILTVSSDGREGPVNYRTSGGFIVIDPLPSNILLRQGKRTAAIWSARPSHPQVVPPNRTIVAPPAATVRQASPGRSVNLALRVPDVSALYSTTLSGDEDAQ
jgi:type IV secretion system protein VirB9